jgi:hypothetical protein
MTDSDSKPTPTGIRKDVLTAHLDGEAVLLHLGTKQYFRLNETGAAIWKSLEQGHDVAATVTRLIEEFDIDAATAEAEAHRVIAELRERDLIES